MPPSSIPALILSLVDDLPSEHVLSLATLLQKEPALDWSHLARLLKSAVPHMETQERVRVFIAGWQALPNPPLPREMALLLQSVAFALEQERHKQQLELIWTGPKTPRLNLRRTDQALIELIHTARQRLLIVSFVVYKARDILAALEKAALRGVEITLILESPDASEGRIAYSAIHALGASLREKSRVFIWPYAKRPPAPDGKVGSLHAKCAVADGIRLYLSSANLTDYAMNLNMEMGVLLQSEDLPRRVEQLFEELIAGNVLSEIAQE